MNCRRFEKLLALHVEGDLHERDARRVETHVEECAACKAFLAELTSSQDAVRGLRHLDLDAAALARVRAKSLAQVPRPSRPLGVRLALAAAVPALALLLIGLIHREVQQPDIPNEVESMIQRAEILHEPEPEPMKRATPTKPMTIKLVSDNPNVVIYWLVDGSEERTDEPTA